MAPPSPSEAGLMGLLERVRACRECADDGLDPRPVLQAGSRAPILIAGQAPGRRVHGSGIPFDDPSGDRLRAWLGVDRELFYDASKIAILPMAFCYPGSGRSGDLPPPPRCAAAWRRELVSRLEAIQLTVVIGRYARDWHLPDRAGEPLTDTIADWKAFWPKLLPAPHPSPRNNIWLKRNPWFERDVLPALGSRVREVLGG